MTDTTIATSPATRAQVGAIYALARSDRAMTRADVDRLCTAIYGCLPYQLTRRQASELIDTLWLDPAA